MAKIRFEDKISVIDNELKKRRNKWQLKARADLDFDDVQQIIRLHIWKKWELWDQTKPLEPWLNTIITRQITNLLRNYYTSFSRPCLRCTANEGSDLCSVYTKQCVACPLFAKWYKTKKRAYDVKLPVSLESPDIKNGNSPNDFNPDFIDYEDKERIVHEKVRQRLTGVSRKVYTLLHIEKKSEDEVAKVMGYKPTQDKRKKRRYKQIENHEKMFLSVARSVVNEEGI